MAIQAALWRRWRSTFVRTLDRTGPAVLVGIVAVVAPLHAQVAGQSINMVTGTQWPTGDPFLERQNEPSMAVSSRNPLHVVAGANDYRTVDLPGVPCPTNIAVPCKPTGDAWLGFFASNDGGNSWTSTLVPGYPQDQSSQASSSPLHGYAAGADPTVRAGTNGMFYYGGLVFNRDSSGSAVFLARYVDGNNKQALNTANASTARASTVSYLDTHVIATGGSSDFLDKPSIAVDMPRGNQTCSIPASPDNLVPASSIPAGNLYVAYTQFAGPESSNVSAIMFSESSDCGVTWSTPVQISKLVGKQQTNQGAAIAVDPKNGNVYVVWRIFKSAGQSDALAGVAWQYSSKTFTQIVSRPISPFDQGTTDVSFRTNAYPSIAVDNSDYVYVAWSQRGSSTSGPTGGDARIQVLAGKPNYGSGTQIKGMQFGGPIIVDNYAGRGHQIMPAVAYSSGKLTVAWYDFRNDYKIAVYTAAGGGTYTVSEELPAGVTSPFSTSVADPLPAYTANERRHTVDIRAARASSGLPPGFTSSILVSQYTFGSPASDSPSDSLPGDADDIQQLDLDAPNLPMFQKGTVPFVGDYIDVAGPTFVATGSGGSQSWRFNNLASDPDHTHVVWTDNRNVVQPADGNWANYTPVGVNGGSSTFDPNSPAPSCTAGQTGVRNQDIYTATLSAGLIMGSKANFLQAGNAPAREYPVTIENPTGNTLYYLITIQNQPTSGTASFLQYPVVGQPPLTQLKVGVLPKSSASRSVFITSSVANPAVSVGAVQTDSSYGNLIPGGLTSNTTLNSDTSNPNISNPNISNIELYNPNISNPNISNPNISNPNISNPNISNPNISNVSFANPNISNPNISNPNISNPNISNPNISNPNISNTAISGEITDVNYTVTNGGTTATSYNLTLLGSPPPPSVTVQLLVSGVYLTPVANACTLDVQANYTPIVNIPNPTFAPVGATLPNVPAPIAPTFTLQPGEQAVVTLRVYDPRASSPQQALQDYNPAAAVSPVVISSGLNTNVAPPPPNTPITILAITTANLPQVPTNGTLSTSLTATGGSGSYMWSSSSLPAGLSLSQAGLLSGALPAPGRYAVPVQVADAGGQVTQRSLTLVVIPGLAVATSRLPLGEYNAPYSTALAATGGTAPYTWSLAPGGVLPAGMGLNAASGTLSGTPGQAGIWSLPVSVTDSTNAVATANVSLTVGLAIAYAGGISCSMPYPATPLYPSTATWAVATASLPNPAQLYVLQGNVLTGCLSGGNNLNAVPTGDYSIGFTPSSGAGFTLPLHVVGQDRFTNGTYFANSGGVGNLPPTGNQQGVVAPGQTFTYTPGVWGPNFGGSFVFGFGGSGPQTCVSGGTTSGAISLTVPAQPGRYDILFDGANQNCPAPAAFPSSPAPLIIDSVDAISTTPTLANVTLNGVSLSSTAGSVQTRIAPNVLDVTAQPSGTSIPVTVAFNYSLTQESSCPGCVDQIEIGVETDAGPESCAYSGGTPASGSASPTVNVPNTPGRYYISIDRSQDFSCKQTNQNWWNGPPSAGRYIAIVDVSTP